MGEKDEYVVISGEDLRNFQLAVIAKIKEGYECAGGISVIKTLATHGVGASYGSTNYYQAMILAEHYGK